MGRDDHKSESVDEKESLRIHLLKGDGLDFLVEHFKMIHGEERNEFIEEIKNSMHD